MPVARDPDDLEREIRVHLELEESELRQVGIDAAEAHRRARVAFGNAASMRERLADGSRLRWISTLVQDVRYGMRLLARRPAFSISAALVLSLGIGATTALFSIVNGLFHRPLGVPEPERLFYFYTRNWAGQVMHYVDLRPREFFVAEARDLADFTSQSIWRAVRVKIDEEIHVGAIGVVESNFFATVGVDMVVGRPFVSEENDPANTERSIVISHELWLKRFSQAPDVVGRAVEITTPNGRKQRYRVVGVAASGFRGLTDPLTPIEGWVTGAQTFEWARGSGVGNYGNGPVGRLKPGVSLESVHALINARSPVLKAELFDRLPADYRLANPDYTRRFSYEVHGALDVQVPRDPTAWLIEPAALIALGVVVTMVLVIATANIAGLLVAQGIGRTSEIAVRRALGARGGRLARQVLTETVVLAAFGGVLGGGIAAACVAMFRAYAPSPLISDTVVDWRVLIFSVAVSIGTGLVVGVMPALQALRVSVLDSLGAGVVGSRRAGASVGRWVLVPQTAIALVLLLVAAVHVRAIAVGTLSNPGFRADGAQTIAVSRTEPYPRLGPGVDPEAYRKAHGEWWTRTWRFNFDLITKLEAVADCRPLA